ncbi:MAG TPA: hypothetical protein VFB78_02495 [Acidimicrobiales bacterium]|nr:hypothetical protein [Acidimicrobiales bacterium]
MSSKAVLGREYLLAGHLIDRAGMPQVISTLGREAMEAIAIEEWMGASPVYTRRVQRALGFAGDDVAAIFKGMQLDIGAPHRFMDFRYQVDDARHGQFWLASCGALMDVEPMGEEFVVGMCHHIEDPTFDATAAATNPHARMRPRHRPPRTPVDRHPHCHWTVDIDPANDPIPEPDAAVVVARSLAAQVTLSPDAPPSYDGPFDPDFQLEHLPPAALARALDEVCLQGHLLVHSFLLSVAARAGDDGARRIGAKQLAGIGGVVSARLARSGAGLAEVLDLHPAFRPRAYVDAHIEERDGGVAVRIDDCPALHENGGWSWALLADDHAMAAIAYGAEPRAQVERRGDREWFISVGTEPAKEPAEVTLTRFSTGAEFVLER